MYHLIGIGGIGMSALARILLQRGYKVGGSDQRAGPLLAALERDGGEIQIGHRADLIQPGQIVVYSTDISPDHIELQQARALQLPVLHRSELLHLLSQEKKALLVTGTHGKTSTTALLASVLLEAGLDPTFAIGGILRSQGTNGRAGQGPYFVAESDESDGSFLKTPAFGAIVTNLEKEHLSYWKTEENLTKGFKEFCKKAMHPEHLFWCGDDAALVALDIEGISYGFSKNCACRITACTPTDRGLSFDLTFLGKSYSSIDLALFGRHQALNAAAVFGLSRSLGVAEEAIRSAFHTFGGTARRLEQVGSVQGIELYDDYGHHPTEIAVTLKALRDRIREKRLIALFQPHRFTRVRDLFEEFLSCWSEVDELILTDIYAAGERAIEGVTLEALYEELQKRAHCPVRYLPRHQLEQSVAPLLFPGDVVISFGAGDITTVGRVIADLLSQSKPTLSIGVLFGGRSLEHDISFRSAQNVIAALDPDLYRIQQFNIAKEGTWTMPLDQCLAEKQARRKLSSDILEALYRCDVCIPVFHGPQGEDGMIQGLLDTLDLPYVGCDYRSGAICMDKAWTKHVARIQGVPTPAYLECGAVRWKKNPLEWIEAVENHLSYPVWVKPVHLGSSIGVSRVENQEELKQAMDFAFRYDDRLIVEKNVEGRQIEFAMLGNEVVRIGEPGEILNHGQFYDYERKYGSQASGTQTPAALTDSEVAIGKELAERMYTACACKGLARVDFFLDREGHYWLNEINPFPGFTATSLYPKMWEAAGMTQRELFNELIVLARHRHRSMSRMQR